MISIDRQAEQIRRRDDLIHKLYQLVIVLALIIIVLAALIFTLTRASASSSCMTKREARGEWPRAHIYWHGPDRCWDRHRGRWHGRRYRDSVPHYARRARDQAPTKEQVFDKTETQKKREIVGIDLDDWLANNCCWPELPRDENGNIIEPFQHRANAVPQEWWSRTYEAH